MCWGWGSVYRWCRVADYSVKTVVCISGVLNMADGAISFDQRVFAMYCVTVAAFVLGLIITRVTIGYRVREIVFRVRIFLLMAGNNAVDGSSVMRYGSSIVSYRCGIVMSRRSYSNSGMLLVMTLN